MAKHESSFAHNEPEKSLSGHLRQWRNPRLNLSTACQSHYATVKTDSHDCYLKAPIIRANMDLNFHGKRERNRKTVSHVVRCQIAAGSLP